MNVKQINLDDDGVPESVFVRMSRTGATDSFRGAGCILGCGPVQSSL